MGCVVAPFWGFIYPYAPFWDYLSRILNINPKNGTTMEPMGRVQGFRV